MSLHRELDLCIRVVLSSLLKLTPLGCKRPTFLGRVTLWSRFIGLLGEEAATKTAFIQENLALVKACFCDYVLNMLVHHMPCELQTLLPSEALSSRQYTGAVIAMGDNLRQECVVTGAEPWQDMDRDARKKMDKCTRAVRFPQKQQHKQSLLPVAPSKARSAPSGTGAPVRSQLFGSQVLDADDTGGRKDALAMLNPSWAPDLLETAARVHSGLRVFPLPFGAVDLQTRVMQDLHSMCGLRTAMAR